tara:strand:- start:750 stop:953 length:204 start_codon:yes stop_codon:yes gene_type:complete
MVTLSSLKTTIKRKRRKEKKERKVHVLPNQSHAPQVLKQNLVVLKTKTNLKKDILKAPIGAFFYAFK